MKLSALTIAVVLAACPAGMAFAQTMAPPVTMQPIANPPEKAMGHGHMAKHHARHNAKRHAKSAVPATGDTAAPSAK